ncbi:MAG: helix-turn-helix domain-containing protein [Phocaeicola sp.]|uniref:helix-turn-helix domain-containing protein n=1 Tax=Phocaeicola sp. TaxID=2773926 RepID=UPI003F9F6CC3
MDDQIKQIAERLKGLRDVLELDPEEVAKVCDLPVNQYLKMESGDSDISVSVLQAIARQYNIPLDVLMFGEEPRMNTYYITRQGAGISVERTKAYKYQSLAAGFQGRKMDPFIVTVEPKDNQDIYYNRHEGQEFNMVIEGRMLLDINGKKLTLNPGDSVYFDSNLPHGMLALDRKTLKFLAIII